MPGVVLMHFGTYVICLYDCEQSGVSAVQNVRIHLNLNF